MSEGSPAAFHSVLSIDPPIFYVKHPFEEALFEWLFRELFAHLRDRPAFFLVSWSWSAEKTKIAQRRREMEAAHLLQYPTHRFIHLCNTRAEHNLFEKEGLHAVFCNQNAFVDERIFAPLPHITKRFDAVYDARLAPYKRHELAAGVRNLALLYRLNPVIDDMAFVAETRRRFSHTHFFNHPDGGAYRNLSPTEVGRCLNACEVGLCLSNLEGAMFASIQYLLCGLPVISTENRGGRDTFFDDGYVTVVDATPEAVRDGVEVVRNNRIPPEVIREATIRKMEPHRKTLISPVQEIYDLAGSPRCFVDEWQDVFFNTLRSWQRHSSMFARLAGTESDA